MNGFLNFFGMSVGGWIGWALGAQVSIFTAFVVSMVGTGVGLFYGARSNIFYHEGGAHPGPFSHATEPVASPI